MRNLIKLMVIAGLIALPILALIFYLSQVEAVTETAAETGEEPPTVQATER